MPWSRWCLGRWSGPVGRSLPPTPGTPRRCRCRSAPNLTVSGHPTPRGVLPLFGGETVVEVKTRGPEAFKRWRTLGAERSHPASVAQAAFYTLGTFGDVRDVVIATMDTGSRQWDYEVIPAARLGKALERACEWLGQLAAHHVLNGPDPERAAGAGLLRRRLAVQVLPLPQYLPAGRGV